MNHASLLSMNNVVTSGLKAFKVKHSGGGEYKDTIPEVIGGVGPISTFFLPPTHKHMHTETIYHLCIHWFICIGLF